MTYDEVKARVAALCPSWTHDPVHNAVATVKCADIATLLAGPPEPSAEEVARVIRDNAMGRATDIAQAVQALYRSRRA